MCTKIGLQIRQLGLGIQEIKSVEFSKASEDGTIRVLAHTLHKSPVVSNVF
jgi:hypothetical protein